MKTVALLRARRWSLWRPWRAGRSIRLFVWAWSLGLLLAWCLLDWVGEPRPDALLGLPPWLWWGRRVLAFAAAFWWVLHQAFEPVVVLGRELDRRRTQDLRPVTDQQPMELQQLAGAVNWLMRQQQESLDQQKKFLADASHQLRTPFAVLRTQLQGAMSGQLDVRETLPKMLSTVDRSSELVRQLLSIAKMEQLVRRANWVEVDLAAVARDVVMEFAPLLARKKLDFSMQAIPVRLFSDPWLLGELVRNLMSNAIQHTPKGGALGLVIRILPGETELLIWDNGGGMDEAVRARLFEPFQSSSGTSGIGLGLSICRQIALSMNAGVDLYNRIQGNQVVGVDAVVRWPQEAAHE